MAVRTRVDFRAGNRGAGRQSRIPIGYAEGMPIMDVFAVVLGLAAIAAGAAAVWLAVQRGREAARAAMAESALAQAARERDEARARAGEVDARLRQVESDLAQQRVVAAEAAKDAQAARRELDAAMVSLEARHEVELESVRGSHTQELEAERRVMMEKERAFEESKRVLNTELGEMKSTLEQTFKALAAEALDRNTRQIVQMAEDKLKARTSVVDELVKPIAETLSRTGERLAQIEQAGVSLKEETGKLVRALREPHVRGRYGEVQLRRVAELAGMSAYCDFCEQNQTRDGDGAALRPDMIVRLPSERTVVVDAKTNIQAYLDALSAPTPEEADRHLARFARHVSEQAAALGKKKYWAQYDGSPEFVVMFIPGDQFVDAALSRDTDLLDRAAQQGVILASPSTLIGLLRAVAVGYREQQLAKAAEELRELGKELHERASVAVGHIVKMGDSLRQTVERYNDFVGSYERRLEPVLRKFEESGVRSGKELAVVETVEVRVRELGGQMRLME